MGGVTGISNNLGHSRGYYNQNGRYTVLINGFDTVTPRINSLLLVVGAGSLITVYIEFIISYYCVDWFSSGETKVI